MQTVRMNITMPSDLAQDFRRAIPARSRSKFISEAVKQELGKKNIKKISLRKSLEINKDFYRKVAKDWRATELEGWPE